MKIAAQNSNRPTPGYRGATVTAKPSRQRPNPVTSHTTPARLGDQPRLIARCLAGAWRGSERIGRGAITRPSARGSEGHGLSPRGAATLEASPSPGSLVIAPSLPNDLSLGKVMYPTVS